MANFYPLVLTGTQVEELQTGDTINATVTGSAATLTTPRAIYGNNFDGSAALTQIIASTYGGTGNGFTKFSGATTAEKTYTLPDATTTILTTNAAVTIGQGGTGQTTYTDGQLLIGNSTGNTLTKATLSAGAGITITNGAGSINIASTTTSITSKMIYDAFTATAAQTTFTTSATYTSGKVQVAVNGCILVNGTDVTVTSGTAVVMATGLTLNDRVTVTYPV